jgi:hypothetical protein
VQQKLRIERARTNSGPQVCLVMCCSEVPGPAKCASGRKNIVRRSFIRICPATAGENGRGDRADASVFEIQLHEQIGKSIPCAIVPLSFGDTIISLKGNVNYKHGTVTPNTYTLSSRLVTAPSQQTITLHEAVRAFTFQYADVDERKDLASSAEATVVEMLAESISKNYPTSTLPSWAPR